MEFPWSYVPLILCSLDPMFPWSYACNCPSVNPPTICRTRLVNLVIICYDEWHWTKYSGKTVAVWKYFSSMEIPFSFKVVCLSFSLIASFVFNVETSFSSWTIKSLCSSSRVLWNLIWLLSCAIFDAPREASDESGLCSSCSFRLPTCDAMKEQKKTR